MRIDEIVSETPVVEAPVSRVGQTLRKAGAKGLAKIGMKGKAGQIAAKVDVGDEANRIKSELQQWMSGSGIKKKELQVRDFLNFLVNAGFSKKEAIETIKKHAPADANDQMATLVASQHQEVTEAIDMRVVDKVIRDLVQKGFKKQAGGKQARSKYATQPATGKSSTIKGKKQNKQELKKAADILRKAGYTVSQ